MDYKIVEKDSFTVMGLPRIFKYGTVTKEIPEFWTEYYQTENVKYVWGMYGVCIDGTVGSDELEYLIADNFDPSNEIPDGFVTRNIPKFTWAVFNCKGPLPVSLQEMNRKIYSEWMSHCKDYEIAAGYNIEAYTNPIDYPKGTQDENYHFEIWIPVKKVSR